MKKTSKLLGIAMAGLMLCGAFVSCKQNPSDPTTDQTNTTTDQTNNGGGDDNTIVIFDPGAADFKAPEGTEVIENNGEKYLKCTPKGYDFVIGISPSINCSAAKEFITKVYAENTQANYQLTINLKTGGTPASDVAGPVTYDIRTEPQEIKSGFSEQKPWNTISTTKVVDFIQPVVQDKTSDYKAVEGFTVFVGKVYATK